MSVADGGWMKLANSRHLLPFLGLALVTQHCANDDDNTASFTDASCGKTVAAKVGERFAIHLASTYWELQDLPASSPIEQVGATTSARDPNCRATFPGSGCGILTATFECLAAGQSSIRASRTTCGEALGCEQGEGRDRCTIVVDVAP
jgi:hypothetical protein